MVIPYFERWGLNAREQRVASIAVYVIAAFCVLAIPFGLSSMVSSRTSENDELREALSAVNGARAKVKERQERKATIVARYQNKAPQLGGFLEQLAGAAKVQIAESADRPDTNHGKQYVERNTVIRLKNSGMLPIAAFLESIAKSEHPVSVTRLSIRKRTGEADSYGPIEIGVSAFDRTATAAATPAPGGSASAGASKGAP